VSFGSRAVGDPRAEVAQEQVAVIKGVGGNERRELKAGAAGRERALVAGSAQVEERRVAGYRMPETDAHRCCDGDGACSAAWVRVGAAMGEGGWGRRVVGLGRRMRL
jgi:hypothetical protein